MLTLDPLDAVNAPLTYRTAATEKSEAQTTDKFAIAKRCAAKETVDELDISTAAFFNTLAAIATEEVESLLKDAIA